MICFVGFILRSVYSVGMTESRGDHISAYRALNRIGFSGRCTIRCMCSFAAVDDYTTACDGTGVPMVVLVRLPFGAFGMINYSAVLKGFCAFFTTSTRFVEGSRLQAGSISCLILFINHFFVKYVDVVQLCFNDISTLRTLNSVLLGGMTLMIRCVCCKVTKRNLIDFYIGCVEKLSAIVAFLVLVPTFYRTGRVLCRYGGLVCVSTGYRYRTGVGKVSVEMLSSTMVSPLGIFSLNSKPPMLVTAPTNTL